MDAIHVTCQSERRLEIFGEVAVNRVEDTGLHVSFEALCPLRHIHGYLIVVHAWGIRQAVFVEI